MAVNTVVGNNGGIGLSDANFDDVAAITEDTVLVIKKLEGSATKTYVPGRPLNAVDKFSVDGQFIVKTLQAIDLQSHLATKAADFPNNNTPVVSFNDDFPGAAGAYAGNGSEPGEATITAGTGNLDGNGNLVLSAGAELKVSGTQTAPRTLLARITSAPVSSVLLTLRKADASNYCYASLLKNGNGTYTISLNSTVATVNTVVATQNISSAPTFPCDFVAKIASDGTMTASANGANEITGAATGTVEVSSVATAGGVTLAKFNVVQA